MTQVPRPALGIKVSVHGQQGSYEIAEINHRDRTFSIRPFGQPDINLWRINMNLDRDYFPVPTRANFELALEQWDYHYAMSDDLSVYERGQEERDALVRMYRALPDAVKYEYKKLVAIMGVTF